MLLFKNILGEPSFSDSREKSEPEKYVYLVILVFCASSCNNMFFLD